MSTVLITRKLEVIGQDKIQVPGCEPTSAVTSPTLMAFQLKEGTCKNALIDLQVALDNIPGSKIEFYSNFGSPRKRFFVLPPFDPEACPCTGEPDWYEVLRQLATGEAPVEERFNPCDIIGMGLCPSPDFQNTKPPPPDPYFKEGHSILFERFTP